MAVNHGPPAIRGTRSWFVAEAHACRLKTRDEFRRSGLSLASAALFRTTWALFQGSSRRHESSETEVFDVPRQRAGAARGRGDREGKAFTNCVEPSRPLPVKGHDGVRGVING